MWRRRSSFFFNLLVSCRQTESGNNRTAKNMKGVSFGMKLDSLPSALGWTAIKFCWISFDTTNENVVGSDQDCTPGTQYSGSSSRHLKFLPPASEPFGPLKTESHRHICASRLPKPIISLEPQSKFQSSVPLSKIVFRFQPSKNAWHQGPQPWA